MSNSCSDTFPTTDIFYAEISSDVLVIVFLTICCILAVVCIVIFVEELVFLMRTYYGNETRVWKTATILGVYPVTVLTSLIALLVPSSTLLLDLIASCYLSVCFYTFVTLTIGYFGGEENMLEILAHDKIKLNTPPCCCCLCCILKPMTMTKRSISILKLCSLQVAVIRPVLLFIAVVLWTDGKYVKGLDGSSSFLYITVITVISTLFSIYGTMVIVKASRQHLTHYSLWLKYMSFKILLVFVNVQNLLFGILAAFKLPECIGTRGPKVRGSYIHHSVLVIEAFLLALMARKAYRRDERNVLCPLAEIEEAGFSTEGAAIAKQPRNYSGSTQYMSTESFEGFTNQNYDNEGAEFTKADFDYVDPELKHPPGL